MPNGSFPKQYIPDTPLTSSFTFQRLTLRKTISTLAYFLWVGLALWNLLSHPLDALGWAGPQHIQINRAASGNLPPDMAAFDAFARPMDILSTYPDIWRETDSAEGSRHYFKPDYLPDAFDLSTLSTNRMEAFRSQLTMTRPGQIGMAPWSILNLIHDLTSAMKSNDWVWAARCGGALSHYVADIHMPFHCTRYHDGQGTGQHGIHMRIESYMTEFFFQPETITPSPPVYLEDPFHSLLGWTEESLLRVPNLLDADRIAAQAAGNTQSHAYYHKLWELAGPVVIERISASASGLSSIWYTAWVNAGKPPIPAPLTDIPPYSVFSGAGITSSDTPPQPHTPTRSLFDILFWSALLLFSALAITVIRRRYGK